MANFTDVVPFLVSVTESLMGHIVIPPSVIVKE